MDKLYNNSPVIVEYGREDLKKIIFQLLIESLKQKDCIGGNISAKENI